MKLLLEKRAFSKDELDKINGYTDEVNQIDTTIQTQEEARALMIVVKDPSTNDKQNQTSLLDELRALQTDSNKEIGTREVTEST